jgi:uncharacterized protein
MRRALKILIVVLGLSVAGILAVGEVLTRPAMRHIGEPPADLHAITVALPTGKGSVAGWFTRGCPGRGAILLLHGVRSDRRQMLGRARFLARAGYSVLLIDLPAHGESPGERITFGAGEAKGVVAALAYLRKVLPGEKIGVIGVSLGAASVVFAHAQPAPDAVVLESMYPTLADATGNRIAIRLGPPGKVLAPLLLWQVPWRLGITEAQLRPIAQVGALGAPVLIASGTHDRHTPLEETRRIFSAAREPRELWEVEGAAHVDLHRYDPTTYEAKVLAFFGKTLRPALPPGPGRGPECPRSRSTR